MRCLSLLLIISLFAVCAIPASAASVPGQYDVVDLLASGFFPDGDLVDTRVATSYTFNWDVTSSSSIAYVYLNVYAPTAPSSVSLNGVFGTRVYSGAFYQYKFSMSRVLSSCSVVVRFSSSASRIVSIGYCVGSISGQDVFTKFNMRSRGYNSPSFGSTTSDIAIPYTGNFVSTITESLPTSQIVNDFELQFDPALSSADYATIHLLVPGGQAPSADGFRTPWAVDPAFFLGPGWSHTYPLSVISTDSFYEFPSPRGDKLCRPAKARPRGLKLVARQETTENADTTTQEKETSGEKQQRIPHNRFRNLTDLSEDRRSDRCELGN